MSLFFPVLLITGCVHYSMFSEYLPLHKDPEIPSAQLSVNPIPHFMELHSFRDQQRYQLTAVFNPKSIATPLTLDKAYLQISSDSDTFLLTSVTAVYDDQNNFHEHIDPQIFKYFTIRPDQENLSFFQFVSKKKYSFQQYKQSFLHDTLYVRVNQDTLYKMVGFEFHQRQFPYY